MLDDKTLPSITSESLMTRFGTAAAPLLLDVRKAPAFEAADRLIAGALRNAPAAWPSRAIVTYCVHGHEVSQGAAAALRVAGHDAAYLEGGITHWIEAGLPTRAKAMHGAGKWITRERPKIDRIACPWLVRRFVDPLAEFLYAPTDRVFAVAAETGAVPYDIPGAEPFSHHGEMCSFDAFIAAYDLNDPALLELARIVRGADTARLDLTPQSAGLLAVSLGLGANFSDDGALLEQGMVVYDALYAWCRSLRHETHNWVAPHVAN